MGRRFIPALTLMVGLVAGPLAAQEKSAPERVMGTTSAAAREEFSAGAADGHNAFFTRAVTHFDKALALDGQYALARALRANYATLSDEERAAQFAQAVKDAAQAPTVELLNILAWRADGKERRALLQTLVQLAPDAPAFAYRLAQTETDPAVRLAELQKVAAKFPDFAPVQNILAYNLLNRGDREGALAAVQQYVKLLPDHPNSHDSYAEILALSGRPDEALKHYEKAVALAPDYAEGYAGIAEVHQLMGHGAQARAAWEKAIANAPAGTRIEDRFDIAGSYLAEGNRAQALKALEDAMRAGNGKSHTVLAHAYSAMVEADAGKRDAVRAHADAARKAAEGLPSATFWNGMLAVYTGDLEVARAAAAKLSADQPEAQAAHLLSAVSAAASGDVAAAAAHTSRVNGPQGLLAKAFQAEALKRAGRKADALALRTEILKSNEATIMADFARAKAKKL